MTDSREASRGKSRGAPPEAIAGAVTVAVVGLLFFSLPRLDPSAISALVESLEDPRVRARMYAFVVVGLIPACLFLFAMRREPYRNSVKRFELLVDVGKSILTGGMVGLVIAALD